MIVIIDIFLNRYKRNICSLPLFILIFGCIVDSGALTVIALLFHVVVSLYFKETIIRQYIVHEVLFKKNVFYYLLFMVLLLLSNLITGGDLKEIIHYGERLLPLFFLVIMIDEKIKVDEAVYSAIALGTAIISINSLFFLSFDNITRLQGSFGNPNSLAGRLVYLIPIILYGTKYYFGKKIIKLINLFILIIACFVIFLTGSRGGLLAIFIASGIFWIKDGLTYKFDLKQKFILGLVIFLGIIVMLNFGQKLHYNKGLEGNGRVKIMVGGVKIFTENPILGIGIGNWNKIYYDNYEIDSKTRHLHSPHNIFLQMLDESGLIGFSGFILLLGFQFKVLLIANFNKEKTDKVFRWKLPVLMVYTGIVVHGMVDAAFFNRYNQMLYCLYWGLVVYDVKRKKLDVNIKDKTNFVDY